ncbi:MAG: TlpA family protein disulfide reductase [Candidatus Dormibacteria bacterium]
MTDLVDVAARVAIALIAFLLIGLAAPAVRRWLRARSRAVVEAGAGVAGFDAAPARVLFFTGDYCRDCKVRQRPALERLRELAPSGLEVTEVDAARNAALVSQFRIPVLPSTVVLDSGGRAVAVNYGFADEHHLRSQLVPLLG